MIPVAARQAALTNGLIICRPSVPACLRRAAPFSTPGKVAVRLPDNLTSNAMLFCANGSTDTAGPCLP
jgi:hypothetical protein